MQDEVQLQAFRNFPLLRLSLSYCDALVRPRVLAFYGLLATLEESFYRASDPVVTRARLGWWAEELVNARRQQTSHPLSEQLLATGVLDKIPETSFARLLAREAERIDGPAARNEVDLNQQCEAVGMLHFELEMAICGKYECFARYENDEWIRMSARLNGLLMLIRESVKAEDARFNWVPLALCARFELDRAGILQRASDEAARALFSHLFESALKEEKEKSAAILPGSIPEEARHWILYSSLQRRLLTRLQALTRRAGFGQNTRQQMDKCTIGDSWSAWRTARQLNREGAQS